MKQLLRYTLLVAAFSLLAASEVQAQNSGFIDPYGSRYKWNITGTINPPLTGVAAVYPNPGRDRIEILLTETAYQPVDVWILNMDGVVLKTCHFMPQGNLLSVDVSNLPAGQYALHVKEAGKEVQKMLLLRRE